MKKVIVDFMAKCLYSQQVKFERPNKMNQGISIPTWKWEILNMDFIIGLLWTRYHHDINWVSIARMTKWAHLLPTKMADIKKDYAQF